MLERLRGERIVCVEVGVYKGENALEMLRAYENIVLYLVDLKETEELKALLEAYPEKLRFIKGASVESSTLFENGFFDYIYIDADHQEKSVREDITAWFPKLKKGGKFAGHDFGHSGVTKPVLEFAKQNNFRVCLDRTDWWFRSLNYAV